MLAGYSHFVALVREERDNGKSTPKAVDAAIERCIAEGYLADYLDGHRAEVKELLLTEFDQELHDRTLREEGLEEGRTEGRNEMIRDIAAAVASGMLTIKQATSMLHLSQEEEQLLQRTIEADK